jgi:hypothetical protein
VQFRNRERIRDYGRDFSVAVIRSRACEIGIYSDERYIYIYVSDRYGKSRYVVYSITFFSRLEAIATRDSRRRKVSKRRDLGTIIDRKIVHGTRIAEDLTLEVAPMSSVHIAM